MLYRAWREGIAVQSDFFRANATSVAAAASLGFISTQEGPAEFSNAWKVTPQGLDHLWTIRGLND